MFNSLKICGLKKIVFKLTGQGINEPDDMVYIDDLDKLFDSLVYTGKADAHSQIVDGLTELYIAKNHDYGDSFGKGFKEYGLVMPVIRLEDKLNRLKSLMKNPAMVADESIKDTLLDLANYAIMTVIEMNYEGELDDNA